MSHCLILLLSLVFAPLSGGGWLGVFLADAERPTITEVVPGSPAAAADLRPGDLILSIDGEAVAGIEALAEKLAERPAGRRVELELQRGDRRLKLEVRLARRPETEPAKRTAPAPARHRPAGPAGETAVAVLVDRTERRLQAFEQRLRLLERRVGPQGR